ncbi:hypothetical protein SAMN04489859_1003118 [Paracoccus alcaliphilus]|uniref:Lipoprotein n=1 Tax=Paracoccus alcaliphilus TaxID=34002 RepID=A0A1H8F477_9RHOB|nr:hypothetical protein [Paracoccus alcaliphilus]WCR20441.1 hypothetical protein JHW40_19250 [Paracoccus alcaliphilus]SEN25818.1 hypothetical protein SAMN04489859_1003118 [Paracoccus alcaliphilus]
MSVRHKPLRAFVVVAALAATTALAACKEDGEAGDAAITDPAAAPATEAPAPEAPAPEAPAPAPEG